MKLYSKVKFSDLFDNKRQAVVCFLSLERRYMKLIKTQKEESVAEQEIIAQKEKDRLDYIRNFKINQ